MEKYLSELEDALNAQGVENVDEILQVYRNRFELGYQADMSDEEIIEMLGEIDSIVSKYSNKSNKINYDVKLNLTPFSDFAIKYNDKEGISFKLDENIEKYMEVVFDGNKIELRYKKNIGLFKFNKRYDGTMYIHRDTFFESLIIENTSCDVQSCNLDGDDIQISTVSGDMHFKNISSRQFIAKTTSGDFAFNDINASQINLRTVSGDFSIKRMTSDNCNIDTVSGDVTIDFASCDHCACKSISGDIYIRNSDSNLTGFSGNTISGTISVGSRKGKKF